MVKLLEERSVALAELNVAGYKSTDLVMWSGAVPGVSAQCADALAAWFKSGKAASLHSLDVKNSVAMGDAGLAVLLWRGLP